MLNTYQHFFKINVLVPFQILFSSVCLACVVGSSMKCHLLFACTVCVSFHSQLSHTRSLFGHGYLEENRETCVKGPYVGCHHQPLFMIKKQVRMSKCATIGL